MRCDVIEQVGGEGYVLVASPYGIWITLPFFLSYVSFGLIVL
jgi:hypothetical protein